MTMLNLQERDWNILDDLGKCQLLTYSQINKLHFNSKRSCYVRIGKLINNGYIKGVYYNTKEKVFTLDKNAINTMAEIQEIEYKSGSYEQLYHKIMRSEFYLKIKPLNIKNYKIEAKIKEINRDFDISFDYKNKLYLVEVHNKQKSKILAEKMWDCLKISFKFTLIIYCKNKDTVKNLIENMNKKGFSNNRKFEIMVIDYKEDIIL
jgi:DNA-binding Lrp family transcriptional regulator